MTLTDAILVLLLAERIQGTDAAIRKSAKNVATKLLRSKRGLIHDIAESKNPRDLMRHIALGLDDRETQIKDFSTAEPASENARMHSELLNSTRPAGFSLASGARRPGRPKAKRIEARKGRASAARQARCTTACPP